MNAPPLASASTIARPARTRPSTALRIRRVLALISLYRWWLRRLLGVRAARLLGLLVAVVAGCVTLALFYRLGRVPSVLTSATLLAWLGWLAGGTTAWCVAADLDAVEERDGLRALVKQRGYSAPERQRARFLASACVIAQAAALPTLTPVVTAMLLAGSLVQVAARALLGVGALTYVVLLGLALTALARWSTAASARHGRGLLVAIVVGPLVARSVWPGVPSVPSVFDATFGALLRLGTLVE